MAILETHDIGKRYGRRNWALRHLDVVVPDGSITALVGPNGSGKSTLLKAWVGFERPTEGRLTVDGIDPWHDRGGALARIGYVPQAPSLYRELTVDEHVILARSLRPGFEPAIARRRLDDLDIPLDSRADQLSGGQQAQVGLALALGTRAPVLLLDEPLASLDPLARREFLHVLVDAVRADGSTALLSSHVITDIEQACDRLLVLGGGRTLLDLSIADAIAEHVIVETPARWTRRGTRSNSGARRLVPRPGRRTPQPRPRRRGHAREPARDARGGRPRSPRGSPRSSVRSRDDGRGACGVRFDGTRITLRLQRFELVAFGLGLGGLIVALFVGSIYLTSLQPGAGVRPSSARRPPPALPARPRQVQRGAGSGSPACC